MHRIKIVWAAKTRGMELAKVKKAHAVKKIKKHKGSKENKGTILINAIENTDIMYIANVKNILLKRHR